MSTRAIAKESFNLSQRREQELNRAIEDNRAPLTRFIRRWVQDQAEAEDVLQDVYEELISASDIGYTIERLSAWLIRVAQNKILDRFRRGKTRAAHEQAVLQAESVSRDSDEERVWWRRELAAAIELLPPEQRQVFVLHELEGKSFKEIVELTGAPMGTLLARKKYAVDFLREYLKEIYNGTE